MVNEADTTDVSENSFEKTLPSSLKLVENINTTNNEKNVSPTNTESIMLMDNTKVNAWAPDKQFVAPTDISSIQVQQSVAEKKNVETTNRPSFQVHPSASGKEYIAPTKKDVLLQRKRK